MADEWWSVSAHAGDGASGCSRVPATDQDAAESAATDYFRPSLHVDGAASAPSFLTDPPHMVDWTQACYMDGGGRAPAGFNALLQLDGAAPVAPEAASRSAPRYADDDVYSSYGDVPVPAAPMTTKPPFSQQHFSAGFFIGPLARNFSGVPSVPPMTTKPLLLQALEQKAFKSHMENVQDACSSATRRSVPDAAPAAKKPRIATPSPLPTFKVRKEKLGDRITALQQLVSPFGKTDTASVLYEAIEYIRFLHDQVASLSSPYLRCGRPVQVQQQEVDGTEAEEDLRSRGLCLVPVASTYAVASETAPEFWHPTFGGTYR